jgi:hypothetical protein
LPSTRSTEGPSIEMCPRSSNELTSTLGRNAPHAHRDKSLQASDPANRRRVARWLVTAGNYFGNAAYDRLGVFGYNHSRARDFPEIPGEERRNPALPQIRRDYSERRELVLREQYSRTGSSAASISSTTDIEGNLTSSGLASSRPETSLRLSGTRVRPDMLEVPSPVYHRT